MKNIRGWGSKSGFALPTVLIASIVMLIVLLAGLVAASSTNTALRQQYYDRLTKEAVESGVTMADVCLAKSNQIATWSDANPLKPNTDCNGTVIVAAPAPSFYILDTPNFKTSFSVGAPVDLNGAMRVNVTGTLYKYRTSGAGTPQTQTDTRSSLVGGLNSFSNVAFGYYTGTPGQGVHFSVVLSTGEIKTLGSNGNGRLGNGTTANATTPTTFILPVNERGVSVYTNFLSLGRNIYAIMASGKVYGAGANDAGQLGNGTSTNLAVSTPVQFGSIGNTGQPKARFVASLNTSTFVMTDNNNIYAAGDSSYGQLGISASPSGNYPTPQRVLLPAVNLSDPNTLPVTDPVWVQPTNMNADRFTMYVRMQGGAVYGWGINDYGQLGTGNYTAQNIPVRLQALSTTGSPYLSGTQIAFNGTNEYVLDGNGQVWTSGPNVNGALLGMGVLLRNEGNTSSCMRKDPSSSGMNATNASCGNPADGWMFMEFWPDKTWRFRTNSGTYLPTDSMLCATAPASIGGQITMQACTGALNQQWDYQDDERIRSLSLPTGCAYSTAMGATAGGANQVTLVTCNSSGGFEQWNPDGSTYFRTVPPPPYDAALGRYPKYTKISTDNSAALLLDENGNAWAAGGNNRGQMGTGSARGLSETVLRQVIIPAGRKVVDFYMTETDPTPMTNGVADGSSYNNSYFILDDGTVYGAGANNYGQLGNGASISCGNGTLVCGPDAVLTPVKMNLPDGVKAKSIQSGFGTTVILTITGKLFTVGNNAYGQLGDGTTTNSSTPKANAYTNQRTTLRY